VVRVALAILQDALNQFTSIWLIVYDEDMHTRRAGRKRLIFAGGTGAAIEPIAAHSESYSASCSNTSRSARSRITGEYLFDVFINSILSRNGVSGNLGAVHLLPRRGRACARATEKRAKANAKNGKNYLAWAFVEAANFAMRDCPQAKSFYERKKRKTKRMVATKALAHKLARACYHMLPEHEPFDVNRCFA